MQDTIYLIMTGEYSSTRVEGFCLTEDDAIKYCAIKNTKAHCCEYYYSECGLINFEAAFEVEDLCIRLEYDEHFPNDIKGLDGNDLVTDPNYMHVYYPFSPKDRRYTILKAFPKDITKEKAIKICRDLLAKIKAEHEGL